MEIKVGEHVRNKEGKIIKATWVGAAIVTNDLYTMSKLSGEITKHSSNIIDLIELGDFVNKQEVVNVEGFDKNGDDKEALGIIDTDGDYAYGVFLEDIPIKTIVTHEQMEQMEYKV